MRKKKESHLPRSEPSRNECRRYLLIITELGGVNYNLRMILLMGISLPLRWKRLLKMRSVRTRMRANVYLHHLLMRIAFLSFKEESPRPSSRKNPLSRLKDITWISLLLLTVGLLLSPLKLPYPPTSPKYRKDMRSTAPIHPSPKPSRFESVGTRLVLPKTDPVQSTTHHLSKPMPTTSKTTVPPCSQLPRCPPGNSSSPKLTTAGATRKLQFGHSGPSALEQSCETCGAWLRSSSARLPQTHPSYAARQASRGKSAPTRVPSHKPAVHTSLTQPYQSLSGMLPKPVYNATTRPNHTYATHLAEFKRPTRDIDECSLSSVSLSNCSVASDLLRRAQERRDHFWTQPQEA